MQITLHRDFLKSDEAREAEAIVRSCVHCGICTATCPTYQELGDERDGPRGRIYLIKYLLESGQASDKTVKHLDRCLTCRSCETSCPSGVEYGRLLDIGRGLLEPSVRRNARERLLRWGLRRIVPYRRRFTLLLRIGQAMRPLLPEALQASIPARQDARPLPATRHKRKMLILSACGQRSARPNVNAAAARVLDRCGISVAEASQAGCCGALSYHLAAHEEGLGFMRRNIDAWWPHINAGVEAIVVTASGCGATIKEYGSLLKSDLAYAEKAQRVSELTRDLSEILIQEDLSKLDLKQDHLKTAVHCPCSLQHAQQLPDVIEEILAEAGIHLVETKDKYSCCGSAGTYSILQAEISQSLLNKKLRLLTEKDPDRIVTANIGCQLFLETKSRVPVQHWIEVLDELVQAR